MEGCGVFGKHPSFGDFVTQGVPLSLREPLQAWLGGALSAAQAAHPQTWKGTLAQARPVRFWLGPSVLGPSVLGTCLRGVMLASRDKVGRVYPLVALQADPAAVPPPLMRDLDAFDALEAHLAGLLARDLASAAELLPNTGADPGPTPMQASPPAPPQDTQDALWAVNPEAAPIELLQAIGSADYIRAARSRSYWWCAPDGVASGAVWSCSGLPDAEALVWLISGDAGDEETRDVERSMTGEDGS